MSNPNDERILSVEHNGNVTYLSREDVQRAYDTILETAVTEYLRLMGILRRNVRESRSESTEMSVPLLQQQQHSQQQQQQQQHNQQQYIPTSVPYYGMHSPLQRESSLQYQQLQLPEVYETNRGNSELLPQSTSDSDEWQYDESIESVHDEEFGFRFSPWVNDVSQHFVFYHVCLFKRFTCARDVLFGDIHISRETHFVPIVPSSSEDTPSADEFTSETGSLSSAAAEVQSILFHHDLSSEDSEGSENLETSECSEISECQETSEISEASENLETSECSEYSVTSECSNPLECLQISECPEASEISETSECSEISEASENLETSECSEYSVTSECSNSLECLQISECSEDSVTSGCSNSMECLQISECPEASEISEASENLETSECSEDSVTSGCSNSSESPHTSEISEDSVSSEISEDSETSECSEDSGNSEGSETSEASEVSDSFQASCRVTEAGRTNDWQYILYSFSEESSSFSLSERTYWPELEFEMDEMATSAFEFYLRQREEMLRPRRRRM
ncbi:hypothetical protein T12_12912 [Trichinella patagoniensis]|uniref:Uncharacterized protein n=1 Tax=Trichinella patagoniensis TaxID=990121 RepID=A0A0V0ZEH7_9BILA|nr:hypothetical protein T12_12912 [Trichinella patagoniensis]